MTRIAVNGTRADRLVAVDALSVISVESLDRFRVFVFICIMAFETAFRNDALLGFHGVADVAGDQCRLIFRWMMVAIVTGNTVSGVGRMGFMVEEDFPGSGFVHDADRFAGWLGGKG